VPGTQRQAEPLPTNPTSARGAAIKNNDAEHSSGLLQQDGLGDYDTHC